MLGDEDVLCVEMVERERDGDLNEEGSVRVVCVLVGVVVAVVVMEAVFL